MNSVCSEFSAWDKEFEALPRASSGAVGTAQIRCQLTDFFVKEIIGFEPSGEGEQQFLFVRKSGMNTADVAERLAKDAGVKAMNVSWSGRKDKFAVTEQWFSVHLPGKESVTFQKHPDYEILQSIRHRKKLRSGSHRANYFEIVLRNCSRTRDVWESRLLKVKSQGFPNYFGEQRFGRGFSNIDRAGRLFNIQLKRVKRQQKSMILSAARSWLFNHVCSERIRNGTWQSVLDDDKLILEGTSSFFTASNGEEDTERLVSGDVHTSGPLWGRVRVEDQNALYRRECHCLSSLQELMNGLESAGMKMERRALRSFAHDLQWHWLDTDVLKLTFYLNKGVFATSLIREISDYTVGEKQ